MAKKPKDEDEDDFEDEEESEEEDEDEDENNVKPDEKLEFEEPKTRRPTAKEKRHPHAKKPESEDRYTAYHSPERAGVMDKETNRPVLEDDLTFKAWVMNKLQKIEDAVC